MIISSKSNNLIKKIKSLELKKNRNKLGLFILEGKKFVDDAIHSGFVCENIILSEKVYFSDEDYPNITVVTEDVFSHLSDTKTPQGILGVFRIPEYDTSYDKMKKILFLDGVQQSENVGALIRSAVCCGYEGVIITNKCADPFSQKAVRSSAGAVLRIGVFKGEADLLNELKNAGFTVIGSSLAGSAQNIDFPKTVLIVGSEGNGMSDEAEEACDVLVKIPILGDCESLNAAVAGGILMYKTIGY
ncbi:MAG: RNA methyltransferase [Anaerofustis stercorihominis]|nr:RNA methyltransferase [Anaerofustis stercorihominis]